MGTESVIPANNSYTGRFPVFSTNTGIYGQQGWLRRSGIDAFIAPYRQCLEGEFSRIHNIGSRAASYLLDALPSGNLSDRQNAAPTCRAFLQTAFNHCYRVRLGGYIVCSPREDERITIDEIIAILPTNFLSGQENIYGYKPEWKKICEKLSLGEDISAPDECSILRSACVHGFHAWRLWWD